ncbi:hypothetical protein HS088_TW12G01139 [Tripterygium wilfordii]|uniref:X8 domain-containing protein n=2 Tax=Tripterygium wilfordii TaxID=458696 RepID=A0A7J7D0N4_TRIWF|nr:hypothetical protein HS088_TW12G01139 [Tripterygium wilfordii]
MAMGVSKCIFLFHLSLLTICSYGTRGEYYHKKEHRRDEGEANILPSSSRQLLNNVKTTIHDSINPSTTLLPVTPTPQQVTTPPNDPTPTIVTVPSTFPGTMTPTTPASNPPIILTPPTTGTVNQPPPVINPVTPPTATIPGAQPITNPVTTYPAPVGNVPVTTPVANPVPPPAMTNAPAIPGQSWCVGKTGASETALQAALDYACGIGGADCSMIQQGGSCYNPNTLQNHASYAFNSYYQKNPQPTSCDFGGAANIVNTNPSTGTCIYPSSSSPSSSTSSPLSSSSFSPPSLSSPTTPSISTPATPTSPLGSAPGSTG